MDWTVVVLCTLLKYSHVERDVLPYYHDGVFSFAQRNKSDESSL